MEPNFHCIYVRIRRAIAKRTPRWMPASKAIEVPLRVLVGTMNDIAKVALTIGNSKTRGTRAPRKRLRRPAPSEAARLRSRMRPASEPAAPGLFALTASFTVARCWSTREHRAIPSGLRRRCYVVVRMKRLRATVTGTRME